MKTLSILTAAAGILLAISGPSQAASRGQTSAEAYSAYARDNSDNAFWNAPYVYQPEGRSPEATAPRASAPYRPYYGVQNRNTDNPYGYGHNLPYPDLPYGNPDSW